MSSYCKVDSYQSRAGLESEATALNIRTNLEDQGQTLAHLHLGFYTHAISHPLPLPNDRLVLADEQVEGIRTRRTLAAAAGGFLLLSLAMFSSSSPAFLGGTKKAEKEEEEKAHTGSWCAADPKYTKHTLKALVDAPVASLLKSKDLKGERKFEASDVITKDGSFYAICDSSWAILKVNHARPTINYHSTSFFLFLFLFMMF